MRTLRSIAWIALLVAVVVAAPLASAVPPSPVEVGDQMAGTEDYVDRVLASVDWVVDEAGAFLDAVGDELERCLPPEGPC